MGRMVALEKWMIFQFTPHQTTALPKWMFFQKLFFKSSLLLNSYCVIQILPLNSSDDLCLLFGLILLLYGLGYLVRADNSCTSTWWSWSCTLSTSSASSSPSTASPATGQRCPMSTGRCEGEEGRYCTFRHLNGLVAYKINNAKLLYVVFGLMPGMTS